MSITKFFEINNKLLNDAQSIEITDLYNSMQTFNYNDIFGDTDFTLTEPKCRNSLRTLTLLKPKYNDLVKATVSTNDTTKHYKVFIFQKDNTCKDWFILNGLKEVYFQQLWYTYANEYNITHNISDRMIVPEIYRYGRINTTTEIIFFVEMNKLTLPPMLPFTTFSFSQLPQLIDYYSSQRHMRENIANIENSKGIFHNDLPSLEEIDARLSYYEEIKDAVDNSNDEIISSHDGNFRRFSHLSYNYYKLDDGSTLLIDFEHTGNLERFATSDDFRCLKNIFDNMN
tara:strand:+ start:730 stop:1584 length:855 start_codon:yes stop_codon:yes gene_type:complete